MGCGALNVIGLSIVHLAKAYAFASAWRFYAAVLSVMILPPVQPPGSRREDAQWNLPGTQAAAASAATPADGMA